MPAYRTTRRYSGTRLGPWEAGEVVEVPAEVAEYVNRDSPGCLELTDATDAPPSAEAAAEGPDEPSVRVPSAPPRDRQVRRPRKRKDDA